MQTSNEKNISKQVTALAGFTIHLCIYIGTMIFTWTSWLLLSRRLSDFAWPLFPTLAWGTILLVHFMSTQKGYRKNNSAREWHRR